MGHFVPHTEETKQIISKKLIKPLSGIEHTDQIRIKNRLKMRKWRENNRDRNSEYNRAYNKAHPQHRRNSNLRHRFGIVQADFERIFNQQDGKCILCSREIYLVVDHCHKTKKVRGLLCIRCNTAIGTLEWLIDSGELLMKKFRNYLETR